jgi:hypothetical protein
MTVEQFARRLGALVEQAACPSGDLSGNHRDPAAARRAV